MKKVTPTLGIRATEAVEIEDKLGIQIGKQIGNDRPPRVYLAIDEFPNGGVMAVITKLLEVGGVAEAWEIPESNTLQEEVADKAAECVQDFLNGYNPEDESPLFFAGNEEMAHEVLTHIEVPEEINVKINEGEPEYIPEPTS